MKCLIKFLMAMVLVIISVNASAVPIGAVVVHDTLIGQDTLANSGSETERLWIESVLGESIMYTQLSEAVSDASIWEGGDGGILGYYALDFGAGVNPEYFLVKVGYSAKNVGNSTEASHFLYKNLESLRRAFINLGDFGENISLTNIGVISHEGINGYRFGRNVGSGSTEEC